MLRLRRRFWFVTWVRGRGEVLMDKHYTATPALKGLRVDRVRVV